MIIWILIFVLMFSINTSIPAQNGAILNEINISGNIDIGNPMDKINSLYISESKNWSVVENLINKSTYDFTGVKFNSTTTNQVLNQVLVINCDPTMPDALPYYLIVDEYMYDSTLKSYFKNSVGNTGYNNSDLFTIISRTTPPTNEASRFIILQFNLPKTGITKMELRFKNISEEIFRVGKSFYGLYYGNYINIGYNQGFNEGNEQGYNQGFNEGYNQGLFDGNESIAQSLFNIPLSIIDMLLGAILDLLKFELVKNSGITFGLIFIGIPATLFIIELIFNLVKKFLGQ